MAQRERDVGKGICQTVLSSDYFCCGQDVLGLNTMKCIWDLLSHME